MKKNPELKKYSYADFLTWGDDQRGIFPDLTIDLKSIFPPPANPGKIASPSPPPFRARK